MRSDMVKPDVSVRRIDFCLKVGFQICFMRASSNHKIRYCRGALDLNVLKSSLEFPIRREDPTNSLEIAEIGFLENLVPRQGRVPELIRRPGPETSISRDFPRRNRVAQPNFKLRGIPCRQMMRHEVMNRELDRS